MTTNSQSSQNEEKKSPATEALDQLKKQLREKRIKVEDLVVVSINAGETIIGELITSQSQGEEKTLTGPLKVRNPKRIIRLQQMSQQGLSIQFMVGDLDMLESGTIQVRSNLGYLIEDISVESQTALLHLYRDFLDRKAENRAREAGLHLPTKGLLK